MYKPTAKSYFSGAGGMDYGLQSEGVSVIQSLEIDPIFAQTLRMNFNHSVITDDISNLEVLTQPKSDIMVGTYPCKKYSTIADISGTRTGDELFLHMFRHIALERPEAYVIENVPGMRKFPVVMEAMTKLPDYYVNVFCPIDASNWLPQKRPRLILIGTKRPFDIREPKKGTRVKLKDILEENPQLTIPQSVYNRLNGQYRDKPIISDPDNDDCAPTCVAHYAKDKGTRLVKDDRFPHSVRPYTTREYARLQGFPDNFEFNGNDSQKYIQIGNAVAIPVAQWIGKELIRYFN
jgi:DNA (cytosine-5)-methyltransferase 1